MYDLKKLTQYLEDNGFGIQGDTIFMGKIDLEKENIYMITNDVATTINDNVYGKSSNHLNTSIKIIYNGTKNYFKSYDEINKLFANFIDNSSIKNIGIIQAIPENPVFIDKEKNINKFVMILNVIYERVKEQIVETEIETNEEEVVESTQGE